ncbi:HPF/RaiA family ribosome-associated protein [Bradyrhizobium ontarionense]|uniref:HPF/RaiA family ribosome-associated protein n=1 Tax=Bradyrhizobium ontarionense TaxID=2898149 RepID=A0ABY3RKG0_9BRAD|nr:HPF/RaiA family ribosome-associated protein [Bradyrhizobium sp. A19]UFZ07975.1 HPF/RaiA family ribosome-associated protein [Bradyrhizobium sp. A19]
MLIDVRIDGNINGGEQLSEDVKASLHTVLHHYEDRVRRIDVHLGDSVGHKTSRDDKNCTIEVHRDGSELIVVAHQDSFMEQAVRGAIHKLKRALDHAFGKEAVADHLRDRH